MLGTSLKTTRNSLSPHSFRGPGVSPEKLFPRAREKLVGGSGSILWTFFTGFSKVFLHFPHLPVLFFLCNDVHRHQANYVQVVHVDYLDYD